MRKQGFLTFTLLAIGANFLCSAQAEDSQKSNPSSHRVEIPRSSPERAIVKIILRFNGIAVAMGTGVFISADGKMIAPYSLLRPVLETETYTAEFESSTGAKIRSFKIAKCSTEHFCYIELPVQPKTFFELADTSARRNQFYRFWGHTRSQDFAHHSAKLSKIEIDFSQTKKLHFDNAPFLAEATEGAAFVNRQQKLVGITLRSSLFQSAPMTTLSSSEVKKFIAKHEGFLPAYTVRKNNLKAKTLLSEKLRKKYIEKAYQLVHGNRKLTQLYSFRSIRFGLKDYFMGFIPKSFSLCEQDPQRVRCIDREGLGYFELQIQKVSKTFLFEKTGLSILPSEPLPLVSLLEKRKSWRKLASQLTPTQKQALYSQPEPLKCKDNRKTTNTFALRGGYHCSQIIRNTEAPNAASFLQYVQIGETLYSFKAWVADSLMADYFFQIPPLFKLSAIQAGHQ